MNIQVILVGGPADGGVTTISTNSDWVHIFDTVEGKYLVYIYRRRPGTLVFDYESTEVDYDYEECSDDRTKCS